MVSTFLVNISNSSLLARMGRIGAEAVKTEFHPFSYARR